jgi:hypothetical protein
MAISISIYEWSARDIQTNERLRLKILNICHLKIKIKNHETHHLPQNLIPVCSPKLLRLPAAPPP